MSSINSITVEKLSRLVGTATCPALIDVRDTEDFESLPNLIPGSRRLASGSVREWFGELVGHATVVICRWGHELSQGVAALLRAEGIVAESLEGGIEAWVERALPLVPCAALPATDNTGRTLWVTRERPKIDRIACPWLIRRFVDPRAVFLFVPPSEVRNVGEVFGAMPFDVEDVHWSHRGELCTFDTMVEEFGLATKALLQLATIVRAADTARLDLAPEAAGLLAASLGLSRMYTDDLAQLAAGLQLYDAFYRWCRDATGETHNGPALKVGPRA